MGFLKIAASFIFSKFGAYALIAVLVGYSYYAAYSAGKEAKKEWAEKEISSAKASFEKKLGKEKAKVAQLEKEKSDWLERSKNAVAAAVLEQAALVDELENKLKAAQNQKAVVKTVTKEVIRYVTPETDAACPITAGFVWLHDLPLNPGLAGSPPGNVDATTSVKISDVARIDAENLAECVERGEVIEAWQSWYGKNREIFERVKKESTRDVPKDPPTAHPSRRSPVPDPEPPEGFPHTGGLAYGIW